MLLFRSSIRGQPEATEVPSVLVEHPKPGVPKPRVIVVEDDPSVLRALRRLILSAGFAVSAFDRPSALLDSEVPVTDACLMVDVHLPEMNGVQLCQMLVASGCHLPLILMTGNADEVTRELTRHADPIAVLFKPFTREILLTALSKAFSTATNP